MDRSCRRAYRAQLVAWIATIVLVLPGSGVSAQPSDLDAWASAFPTALEHDLAAMVVPADAYPVEGMIAGSGRLLRPVDEAAAHVPVLGVPEAELLTRMRDAGWIARYLGQVVPASREAAGLAPTSGWSSVTAYDDATGAAEGYALLDESRADGAEVIPARQIGDAARLSRYTGTDNSGRPFDRLRYTFVSGPLVGSVAIFRGADAPAEATTPEAMVALAERLLARMQETGEARGLSGLVLRLDPAAAMPIDTHDEAYFVAAGEQIPYVGDSPEALAAGREFNQTYGVASTYILHTTFDGQEGVLHQPTWLVALYRVGSPDAAADLVGQHARYDRGVGYDELTELDTLPAVDGPVAGSAYTEAWEDGTLNVGYRITVAVGATVAIVDISAPGGVSEEVAFALVEAQVACLQMGMCAPLPAPFTPLAPSTPAA